MKTTLLLVLLLAVLGCIAQIQAAHAQIFKWVDDKGVVHFTDDAGNIPDKYQNQAQKAQSEPSSASSPQGAPSAPAAPSRPASSPGVKTGDDYRDSAGRGESYWKNRVDEWKKRLSSAQEKDQTLRERYSQLTERANSTKNQTERYQLRQERDQVKIEMDQQRAQIDEAKKMLDKTIPEEAALFKARPEWVTH